MTDGELVGGADGSALPAYVRLPEPPLLFGTLPGEDRRGEHVHPLLGLLEFGPYGLFPTGDVVRAATICMDGQQPRLFDFLKRLHDPAAATDRKSYMPDFPGFEQIFRVRLAGVTDRGCHLTIGADTALRNDPHTAVTDALLRAIHQLRSQREKWDVIVILLPTAWEGLRKSQDAVFDLHDRVKAAVAPLGIPVQFLRESSALTPSQWGSKAWRLSLALFAKAGGIPWRMKATTDQSTAYVGLHYAIRGGTANEFVTCCSQVFDAQGGGLEFVAYNVGGRDDLRRNPHLTRDEMRTVMGRSADLYRLRHTGHSPRRFVVHKESPWRDEEVEGVFDAWGSADSIECVTLTKSRWRAVELHQSSGGAAQPHKWPVGRNTVQQIDDRSGLLWTFGPTEGMALNGGTYNASVKGLPAPVAFTRYAGSGDLRGLAADVLSLTKLDWNNDNPFNMFPVTVGYAKRLAEVVSNVPTLDDNVYPYRLFL